MLKGCLGLFLYFWIGMFLSWLWMLTWNFIIVPIASQWTTIPFLELAPTLWTGAVLFDVGVVVCAIVLAIANNKE